MPCLCLAFRFLFLLRIFFSCFYFVVFSPSSCLFRLLRHLFNKSFIMRMIRLESDSILLLDVHGCNSYVHWRLGYLSNNYIRCSNSFILYRLYHPFQLFWNQTSHYVWHDVLTHIENISLFYIGKDQRFKHLWRLNLLLLFLIFIGEKNNSLDERVTCERPVKYSHGCSTAHACKD
jgi:hypothetical protein